MTARLSRSERQASIRAAAARAFAEAGYASTSMEDIAQASGVTKLIIYRNFASKQDLYRSVIDGVAEDLSQAIRAGLRRGEFYGLHAKAFIATARRDPDGFTLLWRHAVREPAFAADAIRIRTTMVKGARSRLGQWIPDRPLRSWAAETAVSLLVDSTLHWLDKCPPMRDDEFVVITTRTLKALVATWSGRPELAQDLFDIPIALPTETPHHDPTTSEPRTPNHAGTAN